MRRLLIGIGVLVVAAVGALVIFSLAGGNGEDDPAETTLPPVETGDLVEADAVVVPEADIKAGRPRRPLMTRN